MIRDLVLAPSLAREQFWGGKANPGYEKGPDIRYLDWLSGLDVNGLEVALITVNSAGKAQLAPATELGTPTLGGVVLDSNWVEKAVLPGAQPATAANYGVFASIEHAGIVQAVHGYHSALGTDGGAVTVDVEKLTGTQASGGGVTLLGATKINLKSAINTLQNPALTAVAADKAVAVGNRLGLVLTGTPTVVAGLVIAVVIARS